MPRRIQPLALLILFGAAAAARGEDPSLKEAYRKDFAIGVALGGTVPDDYSADEVALVRRQFSAVTPENAMKMNHV